MSKFKSLVRATEGVAPSSLEASAKLLTPIRRRRKVLRFHRNGAAGGFQTLSKSLARSMDSKAYPTFASFLGPQLASHFTTLHWAFILRGIYFIYESYPLIQQAFEPISYFLGFLFVALSAYLFHFSSRLQSFAPTLPHLLKLAIVGT